MIAVVKIVRVAESYAQVCPLMSDVFMHEKSKWEMIDIGTQDRSSADMDRRLTADQGGMRSNDIIKQR